jgi:hypothetical protein
VRVLVCFSRDQNSFEAHNQNSRDATVLKQLWVFQCFLRSCVFVAQCELVRSCEAEPLSRSLLQSDPRFYQVGSCVFLLVSVSFVLATHTIVSPFLTEKNDPPHRHTHTHTHTYCHSEEGVQHTPPHTPRPSDSKFSVRDFDVK